MATEQTVWIRTYAASADLSSYQYFLMKRHTTQDQCALVSAVTDVPIGLLQNKPAAIGRAASIMAIGKSKANVEATTDIGIGDKLGPNTDGRLIKKTADKDVCCAIAEEVATSATGDIISVTIFPAAWMGV
jgi:hypothetical protein